MKYALLVGDGMADFAVPELGDRTPLEYATTPNMDKVAALGTVGLVATVPEGMAPGSDVANLALLGYDPRRYYRGRAPVEAASMGVALGETDVALRCNTVTLEGDLMLDYSAGHVESEDSTAIISEVQNALGDVTRHFYPGVSYRHLLVMNGIDDLALTTVPPHDITGQPWQPHLPAGKGSDKLRSLMEEAKAVLAASEVNARRVAEGKRPVTDIWLWGQGRSVVLPTMAERYGIKGAVISAVDLVRGLGMLAGLDVLLVEGATGYLGTNYAGKVSAAVDALKEQDIVYLHVEAPDETGHEGDVQKKVQAIEEFDSNVVGEILKAGSQFEGLRVLVAPDHATPVSMKTHHGAPVPFAVCGEGVVCDGRTAYSETSAEGSPVVDGPTLFERFVRGSFGG